MCMPCAVGILPNSECLFRIDLNSIICLLSVILDLRCKSFLPLVQIRHKSMLHIAITTHALKEPKTPMPPSNSVYLCIISKTMSIDIAASKTVVVKMLLELRIDLRIELLGQAHLA